MLFEDRKQAGELLANELFERMAHGPPPVVLALPRGGVPVGVPVAERFGVPLDVLIVRKLGVPGQTELAMGAVASGGTRVLNEAVVQGFGISPEVIEHVTLRESEEVKRREKLYRDDRAPLDLEGRSVLLVDDGLATGASMRAAIALVRQLEPERVTVAVPVAAAEVENVVAREADDVVALQTPDPFLAVGRWFSRFDQVSDEEVRELLAVNVSS